MPPTDRIEKRKLVKNGKNKLDILQRWRQQASSSNQELQNIFSKDIQRYQNISFADPRTDTRIDRVKVIVTLDLLRI